MNNNIQSLVQNLLSGLKEGKPPSNETVSPLLSLLGECSKDPKFKEGMKQVFDKILPMSTAMITDEQQKAQFQNSFKSICNAIMPNVITNDAESLNCIPPEISEIVTRLQQRFTTTDLDGKSPFGTSSDKPEFYPREEQNRDEKLYGLKIADTYISSEEAKTKNLSILFTVISSNRNYNLIMTMDKNNKACKVIELK